MPNYTFRCGVGHETDAVRKVGTDSISCHCGGVAARLSVYATAQIERDRKLPGKAFIEASEMLADHQQSIERREGIELAPPSLYQRAKAKAQRALAAGARNSTEVR